MSCENNFLERINFRPNLLPTYLKNLKSTIFLLYMQYLTTKSEKLRNIIKHEASKEEGEDIQLLYMTHLHPRRGKQQILLQQKEANLNLKFLTISPEHLNIFLQPSGTVIWPSGIVGPKNS